MFFYRLHADVVIFSLVFSIFFCFCCAIVDKFLRFWVALELCGISLIPSFFYNGGKRVDGFYSSLLCYVIVSGLSSVLLVTGIIIDGLYLFILIGFLLKFGLFPFSLWVYRVFSGRNWVFIFLLSVVLKFPIIFFCFLLQSKFILLVYADSLLTLLLCARFFWFFSGSWEYIWCHMSLSSVSTLLVACFCSEFSLCLFIFGYYCFWASLCIYYFYWLSLSNGAVGSFWLYCILLLVTPVSIPLFYKLRVCMAILYSSVYLLLGWCVYRFSEQFFLYKMCSDSYYSSVFNNWVS